MELKIEVTTAPKMAMSTMPMLKQYILGVNRFMIKRCEAYTDGDSKIYIDVEAPLKKCLKIQGNVTRFDTMMHMVMSNKNVLKTAKLSVEDTAALKDMLENQTSIKIVKMATAAEIEANGKSFWNNIKEKLKKTNLF